ncbi:trimeric intracellular cation channel family protein [Thioalkalivibrio sp. XN279]|uniref:trimeric intracellular cation channel family protein n=1 Tax=Thioalkalivibrio sp. XN279 TaxID=2714953 RepID=UPI00140A40BC|nr:trimeric intracellular cation channel family protein [Thioalkalivibrio sp. XN279]NHA14669.1 trimeric intracellular cation channel family protein [Thioalkalivibrio sp. XN279]
MNPLIYSLDLAGTFVFALSGGLAAARSRLDPFGFVVIAIVTGLGGGTLRNLLLDLHPVTWVADPMYLGVCVAAALISFSWARSLESRLRWLRIADALGLGLFVVAGTQLALTAGTHGGIAVMMGVTTGIAGGIIRDVLCNEVPLVLQQEIYALAALAGSVAYVLLEAGGAGPLLSTTVAFILCAGLRLAAIRWNLSLPPYGGGRMG